MWKSLTKSKDESPYYINVEVLDDRNNDQKKVSLYKVSVTNYLKLWSAVFTNNDVIKIMLDSNKSRRIEADGQHFLKVGLDMLNNPKQLHKIEFTESSNINLDISLTQVRGIVFSMDFTLNLCSAEQFFYDVTRPLLQIIEDQHKSETELRKQVEGIRGYLSKIPKEILMRYEKQDIEDYNDVKHMQAHSLMESVFGKNSEEGVDLRHILNRPPSLKPILPIKEEPGSTDAGSSTISSSKSSFPECVIKKEPEIQPSESTNKNIPCTNGLKPIKEESNSESKIAYTSFNCDSLAKTNEGADLNCESEAQSENQRTPPKKRFNDLEVKTENNSLLSSQSDPQLSQRHGVLTPKKKRKNLNY